MWPVGATLYCSTQASHCGGFSCCTAWALGSRASVVVVHGLSCFLACGIFLYQGSNPCPLLCKVDSYHCTTREALCRFFLILSKKQLLVSLIFYIFLFDILFISTINFIIIFICYLWVLFALSYFLKYIIMLLICDLFSFYVLVAINFALCTALVASHQFWCVVFLFSFISRY